MLFEKLNGYEIHEPTSGGKAGKGKNHTSSVQVRKGNQIVKHIRYKVYELGGRTKAIDKARKFIKKQSRVLGTVNATDNSFEVWDGGHGYIVARLDSNKKVSIFRWPERADLEDIVAFGKWAKGILDRE